MDSVSNTKTRLWHMCQLRALHVSKNFRLIIKPGPIAKFPYIGPGLRSSLRPKNLKNFFIISIFLSLKLDFNPSPILGNLTIEPYLAHFAFEQRYTVFIQNYHLFS